MKAIRIESVICEGQERLDTADGRREVRVLSLTHFLGEEECRNGGEEKNGRIKKECIEQC